jgi:hypothetical protein
MTDWIWLLRGLEGVILVVGGLIAFAGLRAYRRSRQASLLFLGAGFALVTVAAAAAGALYELLTHDLLTAWIVSALLDVIGFGLILYSILIRSPPTPGAGAELPIGPPPTGGP